MDEQDLPRVAELQKLVGTIKRTLEHAVCSDSSPSCILRRDVGSEYCDHHCPFGTHPPLCALKALVMLCDDELRK